MRSVFDKDKIGEIQGRRARIFKSGEKPIFHCHVKKIGRSTGRSAVACSAYRSGEKLTDENGIIFNFQRKDRVVHSEISLPSGAPERFRNRQELWRSVEKTETRTNAVLAREIEVALPRCMELKEQAEVLREYLKPLVQQGFCADWSIHDDGKGNPHCHIMLTARKLNKDGRWIQKTTSRYALDELGNRIPVIDPETGEQKIGPRGRRMWKCVKTQSTEFKPEDIVKLRKQWAEVCNRHLEPSQRIDHRSLMDQKVMRYPTRHEGFKARLRKQRGLTSDICAFNELTRKSNEHLDHLDQLEATRKDLEGWKKNWDERQKAVAAKPELSPEGRKILAKHVIALSSKYSNFADAQDEIQALYTRFVLLERAGKPLPEPPRKSPEPQKTPIPPNPKAKELER